MKPSLEKIWPPTLLGWTVKRLSSFLLPAPDDFPGLEWRLSGDFEAIHAFRADSERRLADFLLQHRWPPYRKSFSDTRILSLIVDMKDACGDERMLLGKVARFLAHRLKTLEARIDRLLPILFPPNPLGDIDWNRSPLGRMDPETLPLQQSAMLKFGQIPCGLACAFCTRSVWPDHGFPTDFFLFEQVYQAAIALGKAADENAYLKIGSGEPSRHPHLPSIVDLAARRGFRDIRLESSAVKELDRPMLKKLAKYGLKRLYLPIYGVTATTHDAVVGRNGHFRDTENVLKWARESGVAVEIHGVPLTLNREELHLIPDWCRKRGAVFGVFQFPRNEGPSRLPVPEITPRIGDLSPSVRERLNLFIPCLQAGRDPDVLSHRSDEQELIDRREHDARQGFETEFTPRCATCARRGDCTGVYAGYLAIHGDSELNPMEKSS